MSTLRLIILSTTFCLTLNSYAEDKYPVAITKDQPFVTTVLHQGSEIKVKRIQDAKNRLVDDSVKLGKGLLIDSRMPKFFNSETIPGSINTSFILFTGENSKKVIKLLDVKEGKDRLDYSNARELCLYCNGPWCDQSPRAIQALIKMGYPADKLKYYRGGMQLWKIFSLTTVLPKTNVKSPQRVTRND